MKVRELVDAVVKRTNNADKQLVSDFLEDRLTIVNQAKVVAATLESMYEKLCDKDVKEVASMLRAEGQLQITHTSKQTHIITPIDMSKAHKLFCIDME